MRRRLVPFLLLVMSVAVALPGTRPAQANSAVQFSIMMDDNQLLSFNSTTRALALQRMRALGVDFARVTVEWRVLADHMKRRNRKHADSPKAYPHAGWDRYDQLVQMGKRYGVGIYFDVTGPGPRWGMGTAPKSQRRYQRTWNPKPRQFFKFVKAVGRRYSGKYHDENADHSILPRVSFWSIYNEPGQAGWLTPQYKGDIPWSPVMYRNLWYSGRKALDQTGHKSDVVLIGETSPLGNDLHNPASPIYPKPFIREFFCRDSNDRPYRGRAARERHCDTLKRIEPLRYTAWAHHPYTKTVAPTKRDRSPQAITMANIGDLSALLKRMTVPKDGVTKFNLVASTEFGYETDPPDPFSGFSPAKQAEYINVGDYLAYKDPTVISNTQFLLQDVPGVKGYPATDKRHWFTYQSGLYYSRNKPKPSATAYRMPFVLTGHSAKTTSFWGFLRFLPAGVQVKVYLQFKAAGTSQFENVGDPALTSKAGFFETTAPRGGAGTWRAVYVNPYTMGIGGITRQIVVH